MRRYLGVLNKCGHHSRMTMSTEGGKPDFRERLLHNGAVSLSDIELVQILLGNGTAGTPLIKIATSVLRVLELERATLAPERLLKISGLGAAKVSVLLAALEISRRIVFCDRKKIIYPSDIISLLRNYSDRKQEYFICIYLNGAHESIAVKVISIGIVNKAIVHPREVFAYAIEQRAASIIMAHNHPSNNVLPSAEDEQVTERLITAGGILGIPVLDHIVFSPDTYYSFSEHKKI